MGIFSFIMHREPVPWWSLLYLKFRCFRGVLWGRKVLTLNSTLWRKLPSPCDPSKPIFKFLKPHRCSPSTCIGGHHPCMSNESYFFCRWQGSTVAPDVCGKKKIRGEKQGFNWKKVRNSRVPRGATCSNLSASKTCRNIWAATNGWIRPESSCSAGQHPQMCKMYLEDFSHFQGLVICRWYVHYHSKYFPNPHTKHCFFCK